VTPDDPCKGDEGKFGFVYGCPAQAAAKQPLPFVVLAASLRKLNVGRGSLMKIPCIVGDAPNGSFLMFVQESPNKAGVLSCIVLSLYN